MTFTSRDRADLQRGRANEVLTRASALHHIVLETHDLGAAEGFYQDFGLVCATRTRDAVYMRTRGASHHVVKLVRGAASRLASVALSVDTELQLRQLASLPDARIEPIHDPGGGQRVRLRAPGGLVFDAVHGIAATPAAETDAHGQATASRGLTVRVVPAPSNVLRIGHVALESFRPAALVLWLMRTFGMIVSDYQPLDDGRDALPVVSFMRCDRGPTPSDHHTLAIALGPKSDVSHVAFEVESVDEIGRGAAFLRARGHRHAWGVGRHVLGSQLFDYWRAPDGVVVEHYCDGDLFDASAPTGRLRFSGSNLAQWGGPPTAEFALPDLSLNALTRSAYGLVRSEASPRTFIRALRALAR